MEVFKMIGNKAELPTKTTATVGTRTFKSLSVLTALSLGALLLQSYLDSLPFSRLLLPLEDNSYQPNNTLRHFNLRSPRINGSFTAEVDDFQGVKPRPFPRWGSPGQSLPCEPLERDWDTGYVQHRPSKTGLLFVKPPKAGSTTAASVTLRIASRLAQRQSRNVTASSETTMTALPSLCKNRVQHSTTHTMGYHQRHRSRSVLWSVLREPTSRAISQFFHFHVSRRGYNATDEIFQQFLEERKELLTNFQLKYLAFHKFNEKTDPIAAMNRILRNYDFIAVSERMDESLVALQMILGLETADVMHISAKGSGSYDDGRYQGQCVYIEKSFVSPGMESYFASETWKNVTRYDRLFHKAVNRSLDLTIQALGEDAFQANLVKYQSLQARIVTHCLPKIRMPCDANGSFRHRTNCLYDDMGCGFECMDRVATAATTTMM